LYSNIFEINNFQKKREVLQGEIPGVIQKPSGCYFHTRCPIAKPICSQQAPPEKNLNGHKVACHFV